MNLPRHDRRTRARLKLLLASAALIPGIAVAVPAAERPTAAAPVIFDDIRPDAALRRYLRTGIEPGASQSSEEATNRSDIDEGTTQVPALSSRPGSSKTIYLDFDGAIIEGTHWNDEYSDGEPINAPAFRLDRNSATFTSVEIDAIINIWQGAAEDFAPFDVNVTTVDPGPEAIARTSADDTIYGTVVLLTPGTDNPVFNQCRCGGVAAGGFDTVGAQHDRIQPEWVFNNGPFSAPVTVSHEVGHTLGISHDGTTRSEYYTGRKDWGPIMGGSFVRLTQWSNGNYPKANNAQDDLAIVGSKLGLLADDYPDSLQDPGSSPAANGGSGVPPTEAPPVFSASTALFGTISTRFDVDYLALPEPGSTKRIAWVRATVPGLSNLDVALTIFARRGDGKVKQIAYAAPAAPSEPDASQRGSDPDDPLRLSARLSYKAKPGFFYWVRIDGSGDTRDQPVYDDYGSIGTYSVTVG